VPVRLKSWALAAVRAPIYKHFMMGLSVWSNIEEAFETLLSSLPLHGFSIWLIKILFFAL